ncbi:hypothetical protein ACFU8W_34475 [Streptomyces sp. NPDC057565]|uniref:hypothetical protein n=1 Tax=Streptomyces sp. NPDC057565 TaxID=3346169 RepID=UPI0036932206
MVIRQRTRCSLTAGCVRHGPRRPRGLSACRGEQRPAVAEAFDRTGELGEGGPSSLPPLPAFTDRTTEARTEWFLVQARSCARALEVLLLSPAERRPPAS